MPGLLAGCSGLRPGEAAVVGEETITTGEFNDVTDDVCTFLTALQISNGLDPAIPARAAALTAMNFLLMGAGAEQLAAEEDIEVTDQEINAWIADFPVLTDAVPPDQRGAVEDVKQLIARNQLLFGKLGEAEGGNLTEAGQQRVLDYLDEVGYEAMPRYGQALDTQAEPGTGSLSVAVSDEGVRGLALPQGGQPTEAELCN
jgi:hypothetical protein